MWCAKHEFTFGHKVGGHNLTPMSIQVGLGMRLSDHFQSARTNLHKTILVCSTILPVKNALFVKFLVGVISAGIEQALHEISKKC